MKNDRWIHLYTYVHDTSEHDTVERGVVNSSKKQSFILERDTPQIKRQDAIIMEY